MKPPNKICPKCAEEMFEAVQCLLCAACGHQEPLPPLIARPECPQCSGSGKIPYVGFAKGVATMECYECRQEMPGIIPENANVEAQSPEKRS